MPLVAKRQWTACKVTHAELQRSACDMLTAGLQDAYDDLIQIFIQRERAFRVEEVLAPVCVQMASPQDSTKLAREADPLLYTSKHCDNVLLLCNVCDLAGSTWLLNMVTSQLVPGSHQQ